MRRPGGFRAWCHTEVAPGVTGRGGVRSRALRPHLLSHQQPQNRAFRSLAAQLTPTPPPQCGVTLSLVRGGVG